jgi:hypothetical protein
MPQQPRLTAQPGPAKAQPSSSPRSCSRELSAQLGGPARGPSLSYSPAQLSAQLGPAYRPSLSYSHIPSSPRSLSLSAQPAPAAAPTALISPARGPSSPGYYGPAYYRTAAQRSSNRPSSSPRLFTAHSPSGSRGPQQQLSAARPPQPACLSYRHILKSRSARRGGSIAQSAMQPTKPRIVVFLRLRSKKIPAAFLYRSSGFGGALPAVVSEPSELLGPAVSQRHQAAHGHARAFSLEFVVDRVERALWKTRRKRPGLGEV